MIKEIPFDGVLYIISNGAVIYSNQPFQDEMHLRITQNFYSFTKNYYTAEVEYYALANYQTVKELLLAEWYLFLIPFLLFLATIGISLLFSEDIRNRIKLIAETNQKEGALSELVLQGNDEIAELTAVGIALSEKLALKSGQYQRSQTAFQQKNADYRELFGESLYLDALLQVSRKFPELSIAPEKEFHSMQAELQLLKNNDSDMVIPENLPENWEIPIYSLLLAVNAFPEHQGNILISLEEEGVLIKISCGVTQKQLLKLQAIFEDGEIFSDYNFSPDNVYNPFLRLKHCLGNFVTLHPKHHCITIRIQKQS
ncbi:MAG: hypothetical protein V3G42_12865 [Oscillospiraceae bacterium]